MFVSGAVSSSPCSPTSVHVCGRRVSAPVVVVSQSTSCGSLQSCCCRRRRTLGRCQRPLTAAHIIHTDTYLYLYLRGGQHAVQRSGHNQVRPNAQTYRHLSNKNLNCCRTFINIQVLPNTTQTLDHELSVLTISTSSLIHNIIINLYFTRKA